MPKALPEEQNVYLLTPKEKSPEESKLSFWSSLTDWLRNRCFEEYVIYGLILTILGSVYVLMAPSPETTIYLKANPNWKAPDLKAEGYEPAESVIKTLPHLEKGLSSTVRKPVLPPLKPGEVPINSANATLFERLPGIGPKLAERIIADRSQNGPFASIDDLDRVKGIGPKKLAQFRVYLRLN